MLAQSDTALNADQKLSTNNSDLMRPDMELLRIRVLKSADISIFHYVYTAITVRTHLIIAVISPFLVSSQHSVTDCVS